MVNSSLKMSLAFGLLWFLKPEEEAPWLLRNNSHCYHWKKKERFAGHGLKRGDGCVPHGEALPKFTLITVLKFKASALNDKTYPHIPYLLASKSSQA